MRGRQALALGLLLLEAALEAVAELPLLTLFLGLPVLGPVALEVGDQGDAEAHDEHDGDEDGGPMGEGSRRGRP